MVHRPLEWIVLQLSEVTCILLVLGIGILFIYDTIQSTKAALDLGKVLESLTKIRAELEEVQVQMTLLKAETTQKVYELKSETMQKAANVKEETMVKLTSLKTETTNAIRESALTERLQTLTERKEKLNKRLTFYPKGILKRNPSASSRLFGEALRELKENVRKYKK